MDKIKYLFLIEARNRCDRHCNVTVYAENEQKAIEKAKKLIKKDTYCVIDITEIYNERTKIFV